MSGDRPYLSIIMPAYNRAGLITRAIGSCLGQDFGDFELIVVDDASTDNTVEVVESYGDPRIVLVRNEPNLGVCRTRNAGLDTARGEWVVILDTDDEFLPGALGIIHEHSLGMPAEVGAVAFRCKWDTGIISPETDMPVAPMDYVGYLQWLESAYGGETEYKICIRASAADTTRYSDGRVSPSGYNLDISKQFLIQGCTEVIRMYWHDAENQLCVDDHARKKMRDADDWAALYEGILARHGEGLRRWAPSWYVRYLGACAKSHFFAGRRLAGIRRAAQCLAIRPDSARVWAISLIGPISPRLLARLEVRHASANRAEIDRKCLAETRRSR